jgi:hypothetical protein
LLKKIFTRIVVCRTEYGVSVVSESEVLVMFVAIHGESTAINMG